MSPEQIQRLQKDVEDTCKRYGKIMFWSSVAKVNNEYWTICSFSRQGYNHFSYEISLLFYKHDPVFIFIDDSDEKLLWELLLNLLQWGSTLLEDVTVQNLITGQPFWMTYSDNAH